MQNIEPIQFEAKGPGLEIKNEDYDKKIQYGYGPGEWDETHDSLLSQSLPDNLNEVSPETVQERMDDIFDDMFEPIKSIAPGVVEPPDRRYVFLQNINRPKMTLWHNDETVIVPIPSNSGKILIITSNKDAGRSVRKRLISNIKEKQGHLSIYGLDDVEISKGSDYASKVISESPNVTGLTEDEPNELEEQVRDRLLPVTQSVLCSCSVEFGDHSADPEYDILIPLGPDNILNVEVKDYSGRDTRPDEDEIISDPLNQSRLLDIDHVFSIAKGIDSDLRQDFERNAELRDEIDIVRAEDITARVRNYIADELLQPMVAVTND
jgi:hypothetical protein